MAMLTAADVADLTAIAMDAQTDHSLVLARSDGAGGYTSLPAQAVQVVYESRRQPANTAMPGVAQSLSGLTFLREAPFDVRVGDRFELDGHRGGTIRRVYPEPVLGVILAEGDMDTGR
jgi:hypothetical protein